MNRAQISPAAANAYLEGFRTDGDPEVLRDLGIPTDPDCAAQHFASGRQVQDALGHTSLNGPQLVRAALDEAQRQGHRSAA
ncbi:hypothetical protein JNM87_04295 [Candidatus Saccharibacteria bacterium]|nr:hypothetical protein [Candidatus Saccharibacteria bacterium]